jgi:hypothetical protein
LRYAPSGPYNYFNNNNKNQWFNYTSPALLKVKKQCLSVESVRVKIKTLFFYIKAYVFLKKEKKERKNK